MVNDDWRFQVCGVSDRQIIAGHANPYSIPLSVFQESFPS